MTRNNSRNKMNEIDEKEKTNKLDHIHTVFK